jgi:hypothetical protein
MRLITKRREREQAEAMSAFVAEAHKAGYDKGFKAGERYALAHNFPLADVDPEPEDLARGFVPPVRPDSAAERLRAAMLDLDPYSP